MLNMNVSKATLLILAVLFAGCGKKEAQSPAPKPKASPAVPAEKAPEKKSEEAPKPALKGLQKAVQAAKDATDDNALNALTDLRKQLDSGPGASDAPAAAKALVAGALDRAATALEAGNAKQAKQLAALVLGDDGKLASSLKTNLTLDRDPIEATARFMQSTGLSQLVEGRNIPSGSAKPYAERAVKAKLAPVGKAFTAQGTLAEKIDAVLKAAPGTLASAENLKALGPSGAKIVTLAGLLGSTGEGALDLPIPDHKAMQFSTPNSATTKSLPLEALIISDQGVSVSLRPVMNRADGTLQQGADWPGQALIDAATLDSKPKLEQLKPLVDALVSLREKAKASSLDTNAKIEKGRWSIIVAAEARIPANRLRSVLKAAESAGYGDFRYPRGKTHFSVLAAPRNMTFVPADRAGRVEKRPLLVHLKANGADLFEPAGGKGQGVVEAEKPAMPPRIKRWYKGKRIFKYELIGQDTEHLVSAVRALRHKNGGGNLVLLSSSGKLPVARLFAAAAAIAAANGPVVQAKISQVFPGLICKDEDAELSAEGCQSLFPIVLPDVKIPTSAGLTDKPTKKEKAEKPKPPKAEKPKPADKPKLGYCNKGDIARVIRSRKGSFKFCYERRLQLNQTLKGKVTLSLVISESGAVASASTSGSMPDRKVHSCVKKAAKKLRFKSPQGGRCKVRWPFVFRP